MSIVQWNLRPVIFGVEFGPFGPKVEKKCRKKRGPGALRPGGSERVQNGVENESKTTTLKLETFLAGALYREFREFM